MGRIVVACAMIALVLVFWNESASYPETTRRLPDLLGWVLLVLAIAAILQGIYDLIMARKRDEPLVPPVDWRVAGLGAALIGLIVTYAWGIQHAGYLVATPLFLLAPMLLLRPIGPAYILLVTAATTLATWVVFIYFLNLSIPLYPGA